VLLLTDISSKIPVITNKSRERSLLAGNNTDNPTLLYLPKDTQVRAKELVFTSGDGDLFPPNLQVGIIEETSTGIFAVRPFSQWHRLEHVSILDFVPINPIALSAP
jgi:rod shape-determining protein MreC